MDIGIKRLALVVKKSLEMQQLTYREVCSTIDQIWTTGEVDGKLNIMTLSAMVRGTTSNFNVFTLQRMAPFLFKVKYFTLSDARDEDGQRIDLIGTPQFELERDFNPTEKSRLLKAKYLDELPLLKYRYHDHLDLIRIIKNDVEVKYVE